VASFDLRQTVEDGSNYRYPKNASMVITELYPDGFRAIGSHNTRDVAVIGGIEGTTLSGWNWNASATYGGNWWYIDVHNSNNASQYLLGKNAQTSFDCGSTVFQQNTNNINFTRQFINPAKKLKLFSVSTGIEFRIENYQIRAGEEASYENYAPSSGKIGGSQLLSGYSQENLVNRNRYVGSGYFNLEAERSESLLINLSGRYEYYNDFGGNLAGKLALRYKFSDRFMIRGSVSNGFRAPSLHQRYYSLVVQPSSPGISSKPYKQYTFRNDSKIAEDFGIPSLTAEKSLNLSAGITWKLSMHINLIADAYGIQIRNRIVLSSALFRESNAAVDQILSHYGYNEISSVAFFTNAINTNTRGIDIALKGRWKIKKSILEILLSANFNHTELYGEIKKSGKLPNDSASANQLFNREERGKIERAQPRNKIILLTSYNIGKWGFVINNILYGRVARLANRNDQFLDEIYSSKIVTDVSVNYSILKWIMITAGCRNLFNVYPDRIKHPENTMEGKLIYNNVSQFGYNGGYYFFNMSVNF
jgi:iron complex outermembrane receptor protein